MYCTLHCFNYYLPGLISPWAHPWGRAGGSTEQASTEHWSRGRAICDLRSTICDEGRPGEWRRRRRWVSYGDDNGDVTVGYWVWFARVWFWFMYLGFFFFFINTSVFGLLECVLLLYWGLISLLATWWVSFLILCIIIIFFLAENPWACCERATYNLLGSRVGLALL